MPAHVALIDASGGKRKKGVDKQNSTNGHVFLAEQLKHDHLDDLAEMAERASLKTGCEHGIFKADIKDAFRIIPICIKHLWAAAIVFLFEGQVGS